MKIKNFLSALALCCCLQAAAQNTSSIGGVVSDENGVPVIGATVKVKGTNTGAVTDIDGRFTLDNVKAGQELEISYVGKETITTRAKQGMKVRLADNSEDMDEIIVVAYGQQKKSSFTGSAGVVDSKILETRQVNNVMDALQGNVAGLQSYSSSGSPDAVPEFRIRGISSLNAGNDPLIVLDGVPYDGLWSSINPADVASVTVLKDAASNALYGARGANGVIIITTKKGEKGKTTINLDAKLGWSSRASKRYETIDDPAEYLETHYKSLYNYYIGQGQSSYAAHQSANATIYKNAASGGLGYVPYSVPDGQYLIGDNGKLNPNATLGNRVYNNGEIYTIMPDDWIDETYRTSLRQEYNLSINGGSEKGQFYGSMGYLDNEGIVVGSDFNRYTARMKASYQAAKWLNVGGNINFMHSKTNNADEDASGSNNIFSQVAQIAPIYPVYVRDANGNILYDEHGAVGDYGDGMFFGSDYVRPLLTQVNGITEARLNTYNTVSNTFTLNGFADISIWDGLSASITGNVYSSSNRMTMTQEPWYGYGYASYPGGYVYKYDYNYYSVSFQQLLKYNKSFGKHNVSLLAGHESYRHTYDYLTGDRKNMFSYFGNQELNGATTYISNSSYKSKYNTEGWIFRALYDYDGKYFGQVSYRRDGSSRFHPDHRWGNFYSFGGAWILTKESWMESTKSWLDMLKVKASFGQNGNDNISDFLYTDTYTINKGDGNDIGLVLSHIGNENITWETVTNINAGIEFELFKHRLRGGFDYFYRKTTDMLSTVRVPLSQGTAGYSSNVGDMVNKGLEFELSGDPIATKNVTWTLSANLTTYKNKIVRLEESNAYNELDGHPGYSSGSYFYGEGLSMYTWRLKKYAGVNDEGLSTWYIHDAEGKLTTTTDPTDIVDDDDYYNCGTALPDFYGGFGTTLSAYGFDFNVNFAYSVGGKAMDWGYQSLMTVPTAGYTGMALHKDLLNAWTSANPTDIPRLQYGDEYAASTSDRFLTNASWLALQNISLGYTLPKKWLRPVGLTNVRLYVSGENLTYWSKRKGFDPRISYAGSVSSDTKYAPARTVTAGISVQF